MKNQNNIFPYHDSTIMEQQSVTDLFLDFSLESPAVTIDEFVGPTSEIISNSTVNNTVASMGGSDNVNIYRAEELPIIDDFIRNILNDSGNGEGNLSKDFAGNNDQPPILSENPCSGCFVLREMVHTNGFRVAKLELHGEIGIINHVVLNVYDQGIVNHAEFHKFDFSNESFFTVKNFLVQYCDMRTFEGYWLIPDAMAHFYDALSVGIHSNQENLYMFSQPPNSMASVNQTFPGSEQNSVLTPINNIPANVDWGESSLQGVNRGKFRQIPINDNNIPANANVGESSLQGADKGKGKEKTEYAMQRERTAKMKLNEFNDLFEFPMKAAAEAMNVSISVVKKKSREVAVARWPSKKIKRLNSTIEKKRNALENARTLYQRSKILEELAKL